MEAEVKTLLALQFISVSHQKAFLSQDSFVPQSLPLPPLRPPPSPPLPWLASACPLSALPHSASWPFWFCLCILALFSNILPLVIWPTFYLRILPSSVSGSLKISQFSQVCLVMLFFPSHWDELCVFTPFILFLYENRSPFLEFIIK